MVKRIFDLSVSLILIIIFSPIFIIFSFLIWKQDWHPPFYIASRVGKNEKIFKMIKFRSMIVNADKSGVDSTSENDSRITSLGRFIRKYKIDELPNFFNIIKGDMSFVGPRPNVKRESDLYTNEEKLLLKVRPGITDFASIVFSDEGNILSNSIDPDIDYNQLIRPWKSMLGLYYIDNRSFILDVKIIFLTILNFLSREKALKKIHSIVSEFGAKDDLLEVILRKGMLVPTPPPGSDQIVQLRS